MANDESWAAQSDLFSKAGAQLSATAADKPAQQRAMIPIHTAVKAILCVQAQGQSMNQR